MHASRSGDVAVRPGVLVVDDEPEIVEELCELLQSRGYHTAGARCVPDALAALEAEPAIFLVITDLSMPGTSGLDLIRECRRRATLAPRGLRFVLATGQTDLTIGVRSEIEDARISLMLKPIRPRDLLDAIAGELA
jgi:CheY-like chemotaxis protein